MSMMYADWVNIVGGYLPETVDNTNTETPFAGTSRYNTGVDRAIEYAELRMYRDPDFDFLATRESLTATMIPSSRLLTIPAGMIVLENVNVITPAGQLPGSAGSSRNQLNPVSVPYINTVWPNVRTQQMPTQFARYSDTQIIFGANTDLAYVTEFYGTVRPAPLSYENTSTVLTLNFPDLFLAASMIWWSMYQKSLGAVQSLGPLEGVTWEQQYENLKKGAAVEEARKKFQSSGWTGEAPTTVATPPRQ